MSTSTTSSTPNSSSIPIQTPKVKKIIKKKTKPNTISPPPNEEIVLVEDFLTLTPTKNKTKEEEENEFINHLNELQKKAYNIAKCHLGSSFNLAKSNIYHSKN